MGSPRVKGTNLSFLIDGIDYWMDATSVVMDCERHPEEHYDGSVTVHAFGWWFDVSAAQSTAPDSFWSFLWEHHGKTVPFAYAPHGNKVPTEHEPHFTGILTVPAPAALGGAAGRHVDQTFTTRLHIAQGPIRVTTT